MNKEVTHLDNKSKYYTPDISEFCIGFEYESLHNKEWLKLKLDTSHSISKITNRIKQNEIKVKHLDSDDIKSLGWKLIFKGKNGIVENAYIIDNSSKQPNISDIWTLKEYIDGKITIHRNYQSSYQDSSEGLIFNIKNKLELKKLMLQLEII